MTTIVTRAGKGSPLTNVEVDANFTNLNNDKIEKTGGTITANSSSAALTITQTGTGNAFVVEDSASPDSTPFVINNMGQVLNGFTVSQAPQNQGLTFGSLRSQVIGADGNLSSSGNFMFSTGSAITPVLFLAKSSSATVGTHGLLPASYNIGSLSFNASDGTNFVEAASILASVDSTSGTNNMPGRLVFATTSSGSSTPVERMRIDSAGRIGFSATPTNQKITIRGISAPAGGAESVGVLCFPVVQSDTTYGYYGFWSTASTQAAAFTLGAMNHFYASQDSIIGAGSTVTKQFGFRVESNLTGATNNYGFYSSIPAGTGRWNFYAAGTADNAFAGNTRFGSTAAPTNTVDVTGTASITANSSSAALKITQTGSGDALRVEDASGDTSPFVIDQNGNVGVGTTTPGALLDVSGGFIRNSRFGADAAYVSRRAGGTASSPTASANGESQILRFDYFDGSSYISAAQMGVVVDGTPGTNDMPGRLVFSTTADGASSPTERMRIRCDGNVEIGATGAANYSLLISKNVTGATIAADIRAQGTIQSDVTDLAIGFTYQPITAASAFTCNSLQGFRHDGVFLGAGSAVANQYGFLVGSSTTGATNNYGFYSSIPAGTGRWNVYAAGSANNYFAGNVGIGTTPSADSPLHIFSNAGGIKRVILHNAATTANTTARYDLATGTPNAYSILGQTEDGAGNVSLQLATGVGVNQGIRLSPAVGNVTVNTVAGLGYGTGAGGTVTQATSKSTAVTLNKPTGQITMHNAALAAGTEVYFAVNNSLVAANDVVVITANWNAAAAYSVRVYYTTAGSFNVAVKNNTAGSLSDAVLLNFAIIKGAVA